MGDMKTPDFDDLLAAFDIPDATGLDAKEAIVESHDEAEGQPKSGVCMEDLSTHSCLPIPDVPAVSVIVKNTSRQESYESNAERDGVHLGPLLQNGSAPDSHHMVYSSCGKPEATFANGDRLGNFSEVVISHRADKMPSFSQFSPISSPEPEDCPRERVVGNLKQDNGPYFSYTSAFGSANQSMLDSQGKMEGYSVFDKCHESMAGNETVNNMEGDAEFCKRENSHLEQLSGGTNEFHVRKTSFFSSHTLTLDDLQKKPFQEPKNFFSDSSMGLSCHGVKNSNSKLSSCLAALVALNAKKFSEDPKEEPMNSKNPLTDVKDSLKISPKVPKSPKSPRSPLEVVKRYVKPPDSPMSICSDSSGKASPSVTTGSPPAIPRVRIKTIKTSSGQIKRTVTSVLPDSELEELQSPAGSSPSQYAAVDEPSSKPSPVHGSHDAVAHVIENGSNKNADRHAARVIPSSAGSPVPSQGCAKGSAVHSTSLHSTCSTDVRCITEAQQQTDAPQQTVGTQNTSFLPKAVHLANLNLVPHSVAASVTARCATQRQPQLSSTVVCSTVPLVHQVKSPEPRPCAAVPSTAVGTLNRLLNAANPVPTYVPNLNPPEHVQLNVPARGHRCLECGDSFSLEKSLSQHYSRRSVHIEVACTHCTKVLVFFNKCSLLAHARQHKSQGAIMQCTQFLMRPIAADQMFAPSLPGPSGTTRVVSVSAQSARTSPQPPVMPLYPDKTLPHGMRCLECNKHVPDLQGLAGHYQRLSEDVEKWTCKVCMMMLPNKCSYKAHQRIHTHTSPYCCPECGALTRSMDIQRHVKENCLHYARKIGYKCSHCDMFQMSFRLQKSHIEEKHCEVFYKCSICPVAFKTSDGSLMHLKNKHNNSKASPLMIYRCSCEMVFKRKQLLLQHFHQNAKKLTCCVFKCPECAVVFIQKQMLMQHFKSVHGGIFRADANDIHGATLMLNKPEAGSVSSHTDSASTKNPVTDGATKPHGLKNAGWTCGECLQWVPDRDAYVSHIKSNHSRSVKRYPCQQCERSFNSTMSLKRHIRNDHGTKRKMFTCWYCTDKAMTFTKHFMLKNHISLMHGIKNPDFSQMCKAPPPETSEASVEGSKTKRASEEGLREVSLEVPPAKRPSPRFRCSKCGFTTEDCAVFQEHIPQHKSDDQTPQCLHCGLCFTSRLALSRHLLIVHKVKEPEESEEEPEELDEELPPFQDGKKEDASTAAGQSSSSGEKASASLHCDTCSRAFDSESAYNSHVQTHSSCLTSGPEP